MAGGYRGARPGLAVMASADDAIGVELRGTRAVAWRTDGGRITNLGAVRVGRPGAVELRIAAGRSTGAATTAPNAPVTSGSR